MIHYMKWHKIYSAYMVNAFGRCMNILLNVQHTCSGISLHTRYDLWVFASCTASAAA